jgi:hypothetical protein
VLNIGGVRGAKCPLDHWLYLPASRAGFHRVGFCSNVDIRYARWIFQGIVDSLRDGLYVGAANRLRK